MTEIDFYIVRVMLVVSDLCEGFCVNQGVCDYGVDGEPLCNCRRGFTGPRCQDKDMGERAGSICLNIVYFYFMIFV